MKEIEFWINGIYYKEKEKNITIFQKSFEKEVDIPCFCYHENLSIAGNCRMCLVELNTSVKLVASCAMPILNGMQIDTTSLRVKKARESVIEFLLINHPLDCPVCDQAGECDLQDITLAFGSDRGRYYEYSKRAVIDKEGGPFIRMIMTRCIHCTRCIRFFNEISGNSVLGMINRGGSSEISTYITNNLIDELSGNVIDLCPVGALTSKPYSFVARPWELNFLESIDFLDSVCSNIRIDFLNNKVYRILPIYNRDINEDWITNRVRFFYDSNNVQRLSNPLMKNGQNFVVISWLKLFYLFFFNLLKHLNINSSVLAFNSMFSDLKSVNSSKVFFNTIGSEVYYADFLSINSDFRENFLINNLLVNLDNNLVFVFFCFNSRLESPILNSRLRKLYLLNDKLSFYGFGLNSAYLNLPIKLYGNSFFGLISILKSRILFNKDLLFDRYNFSVFNNFLKKDRIIFFFGIKFFYIFKSSFYLSLFKRWINDNFYSNISVIFPFVGYLNFFELNSGLNNIYLDRFNFIYLSNVDDVNFLNMLKNEINYIIYKGSFFENGAKSSDLIIPSYTFFESDNEYINIEGRLRRSLRVLSSNHNLISDFDLFNFLNIFKNIYVSNNFSIFKNFKMILKFFDFLKLDFRLNIEFTKILNLQFMFCKVFGSEIFENLCLDSFVLNYYKMDVYSRNSNILHSASFDYLVKLNTFSF